MGTCHRSTSDGSHRSDTVALDVRAADVSDAPSIAGIHVRSFQSAYSDVIPEDHLGRLDASVRSGIWAGRIASAHDLARHIVIAEAATRTVGFIYYGPSPDADDDPTEVGHVFSIHVDPAATARGTGTNLLLRAVKSMAETGFVEATLWVVEANLAARRFYRKLGWRLDGARRSEHLGLDGEPEPEFDVAIVRYRLHFSVGGVDQAAPNASNT
jgi:ribosomal protein S18 acetylase RimI-like enzyme